MISQLQNHFDQLNHDADATLIYQVKLQPLCQSGHYFAPCAFEIKQLSQLQREFFGPFLHVIGIVKSEVRQSHSIFLRMFFENIQPVTRHYGAPWGAY